MPATKLTDQLAYIVASVNRQLEEDLAKRLSRLCGIALPPEQLGQLSAVDGFGGPACQVRQQRQPDARAGESGGGSAVELELTQRAQHRNGGGHNRLE